MYKVYKVISNRDTDTVYIGSTKYSLKKRLGEHKSDAKNFGGKSKKHKWIVNNLDSLEIIEINSIESKKEALCAEESEVLRHIQEGYTVLNAEYPVKGTHLYTHSYKEKPVQYKLF